MSSSSSSAAAPPPPSATPGKMKNLLALPTSTFTIPGSSNILTYDLYGAITTRESPLPPTIFFHHGLPGSHVEAAIYHATASSLGVRIVSVNRPGMHHSTFQPDFRVEDWPAQVLALADHLGVDKFAVLAVSGGAPYALACLRPPLAVVAEDKEGGKMMKAGGIARERCVGGGIVAGVYPYTCDWTGMAFETKLLFTLGSWSPWCVEKTLEYILGGVARDGEHPERLEEFLGKTFESRPQADKVVWQGDENGIKEMLVEDSRMAFVDGEVNGSKGAAREFWLAGNRWGWELGEIEGVEKEEGKNVGRLVMWHGGIDANWPVNMARNASREIKGSELRVWEGDGHVSVFARSVREVVTTMKGMLEEYA